MHNLIAMVPTPQFGKQHGPYATSISLTFDLLTYVFDATALCELRFR